MNYGLIGEKLGHSFSKIIHEQLADYTYNLIPLTKEEFKIFMTKKDFKSINVTIPYKQDVIPYLYYIDENAKSIGAVNTIVNKEGLLYGYNTDFTGFLYTLNHNNIEIKNKKVIVLGNGGASKAIIAVLKYLKAKEILIVYYKENPNTITYEECYNNHTDADIIINTTPVGMYPNTDKSPIDLDKFKNCKSVVDIVYNPLKTKLLIQAEDLNIKAVNGLEMLVAQAKYAVEYFLDKKIDDNLIDKIYKNLLIQRKNIVLIGMPSSGKTTIGNLLSEELNRQFIDIDSKIVEKIGMSIAEYFKEYGEEKFRDIETEVCKEISHLSNLVISTGGGCIKRKENMNYLKLNGTIIFIERDIEKLSVDPSRPLSTSLETLKTMYNERYPLYKKYSDIIIYNNEEIEKCVEETIKKFLDFKS